MQEYEMTLHPADGSGPVTWRGQAVCFMDACLLARQSIAPELGSRVIYGGDGRTYWELAEITASLPLFGRRKVP